MLKLHIFIVVCSFPIRLNAQTNYQGYIDKLPIELVIDISADGGVTAVYTYQKFNEPIVIKGIQHGDTLALLERDKQGNVSSTLTFFSFKRKKSLLTGTWKNLQSNEELPIKLSKEFEIEEGNNIEWKGRELIQLASLNKYYFKLVTSKLKGDYYARITGVKVLQKKTGSLVQMLTTDCQLGGLDDIEIDDYNFDGSKDFSIFESSYAGPNTSRVYFLFKPETRKFFDSKYKGISLEFDQKKKRIYEHNQCCAGLQHMTATYKLVKNKMVLIDQHCLIWNEKRQDFIERKMKACQ